MSSHCIFYLDFPNKVVVRKAWSRLALCLPSTLARTPTYSFEFFHDSRLFRQVQRKLTNN